MGYDINDANDVYPYAMSNVDFGLTVQGAVNGYGLVTHGFLWQLPEIWFAPQSVDGVSSGWSLQIFGVTTTGWSLQAFGVTQTGWTLSEFGVWGEGPPAML